MPEADWVDLEPPSPANEPVPVQLALTDECDSIPATRSALVPLAKEEEQQHSHTSPFVQSAALTQEDLALVESADEAPTAAPAASADEAPTAAPAAPKSLSYREATDRVLFMSWNAGGGARNAPEIL